MVNERRESSEPSRGLSIINWDQAGKGCVRDLRARREMPWCQSRPLSCCICNINLSCVTRSFPGRIPRDTAGVPLASTKRCSPLLTHPQSHPAVVDRPLAAYRRLGL